MLAQLYLVLFIGMAGLLIFTHRRYRQHQRDRIMQRPVPEAWNQILAQNLPPYEKLPPELRQDLHQKMHLFLATKTFEGCGGLELTDEIQVTIAAQACMLLLNRQTTCYPKLSTILVYPEAYVSKHDRDSVRLGESWTHGPVVLSWSDVKHGAYNFQDGRNVSLHEFAHQLDQEDGKADGAPILEKMTAYSAWARTFSAAYEKLQYKVKKHKKKVFRAYGATNPAEFFAVATETFFEKPGQLQKRYPELYAQMRDFYKVDPLTWR